MHSTLACLPHTCQVTLPALIAWWHGHVAAVLAGAGRPGALVTYRGLGR